MTNEERKGKLLALQILHTAARKKEKDGNAERIAVESELFALYQDEVKETGTTTHDGILKITTAMSEKWDQEVINEIWNNVPKSSLLASFWPFKDEWKKDSAALKVLKDRDPESYSQITKALTLTPNKPRFEFKEAK